MRKEISVVPINNFNDLKREFGDIEGLPFYEAIRQFRLEIGKENVAIINELANYETAKVNGASV